VRHDRRCTGEKLKVFISYSRKDSAAFVDDLVVGLEDRGFAPMLDRHDIKPGEPWEARLGGLIKLSDTVVFVVSPEAVKSEIWRLGGRQDARAFKAAFAGDLQVGTGCRNSTQTEGTAIYLLPYRARRDAPFARTS
jgi:hypothetical protein